MRVPKPIAIINSVEMVLSLIIAGLISGFPLCHDPGTTEYTQQFIHGVVFGFLIIDIIVLFTIAVPENLGKFLRMLTGTLGSILWLTAAALILKNVSNGNCVAPEYFLFMSAGVLGLISCIVRAGDVFLVSKKFETTTE